MSELYDSDFVLWSEQQADRLRQLARGEKVNDVDWANLVEEVEGLGKSATSAVRSLLLRALEHLLKAAAWPQAPTARKWVHEADVFLGDAQLDWAPSMGNHIEVEALYRKALRNVRGLDFEEGPPGPLPAACPVTLAELLADEAKTLVERFRVAP